MQCCFFLINLNARTCIGVKKNTTMVFSKKECSEFYMCNLATVGGFNTDQILLVQYEMMDTAIFIKNQNKQAKIVIHNFAHNKAPCNGLWDSNSQENQIYNRTDIKESILEIQYKLYPIQQSYQKGLLGDYSMNMVVSQGCRILKTESGQDLKEPIPVDVISMPAIVAPVERNLDIYANAQDLSRTDYAIHEDKEIMKSKIRFILKYAINESYDYLLTGEWGVGAFLNPQWGMINLWNECIMELPDVKLIILFCIPVQSRYSTEEMQYNYKYFCKYLVGQENQNVDFEKIRREKEESKMMAMLLKDNDVIRSKIYGLVWGVLLAEINNHYMRSKDSHECDGWVILSSGGEIDWEMCTDMTIVMMRALRQTDLAANINVIASHLVKWKTHGFKELAEHNCNCDYVTKHLLSQPSYAGDPIGTSNHIYASKGKENLKNMALAKNMINGIFKDYMQRSVTCCLMTNPDQSSQITCLIHSFVIRSIWENKYVTSPDISRLLNMCFRILDKDVQRKIDFDTYMGIARNYQNQKSNGLKLYINNNLKPSPLRPGDNIYVSMAIILILLYDMQGYYIVNGKPIRNLNVIEMLDVDEMMLGKKINYDECLPADYYFQTMETISGCNPDPVFNAVAGSIVGLACCSNVYNDVTVRDDSGNIIESDSQKWVKHAVGSNWVVDELDKFLIKYLDVRKRSVRSG